MNRVMLIAFMGLCLLVSLVGAAFSKTIANDTVWQGEVNLREDILIPAGVVVTIRPGTHVNIWPAENTQIDPEYLSYQTEILVRGRLLVVGSAEEPVVFAMAGECSGGCLGKWAGIIVQGGRVTIRHAAIKDAEVGGYLLSGSLEVTNSLITGNRYGLIAQGGGSELHLVDTLIQKNDYGLGNFAGAHITRSGGLLRENSKKDEFTSTAQKVDVFPREYFEKEQDLTVIYTNETLRSNTIWSGRIRVEGQIRVEKSARLVILPGTVVEFTKRDSDGDGIGENGILVQGGFFAKGTKDKPIVFRSAEPKKAPGDWDSINILGSDQTRNLLEFCRIEDAYRGVHLHFANMILTNSVFYRNLRGLQFQESLVEIRNNQFFQNNSAIRARNSQLLLKDNHIINNINGVDLFRINLEAYGNLFANNLGDGLRIREGKPVITQNSMVGNRNGLVVYGTVFGQLSSNILAGNLENGLVLRDNANIECEKNAVMANGINGIKVKDSQAIIRGNFIADNKERGIGVSSFAGQISANHFSGAGIYAIGLDGPGNVDARGNWWAGANMAAKVFDVGDDSELGLVDVGTSLVVPPLFTWPVPLVPIDLNWDGEIRIVGEVKVGAKVLFTIKPGTVLRFAKGAGFNILGTIKAVGLPGKRITFTSMAAKGARDWGEIALTKAMNSVFERCDFEYSSWGIHSHLTNLKIKYCRFRKNDGGVRFRGSMDIAGSIFRGNRIGIRAFRGIGEFRDNVISGNEIGIFVREKGAGLRIVHNNLNDNERYSLRLGDFNDEDVRAENNWWGDVDVVKTVFDSHREPGIGKVLYEPTLPEPIVPELKEWQ